MQNIENIWSAEYWNFNIWYDMQNTEISRFGMTGRILKTLEMQNIEIWIFGMTCRILKFQDLAWNVG